jgi:hypothetical protein
LALFASPLKKLALLTMETSPRIVLLDGRRALHVPASVEFLDDKSTGEGDFEFVFFETGSRLREFAAGAFAGRRSLQSICIPETVTLIGDQCISNCPTLSSVTFACPSSLRGLPFADDCHL